MVVILVDVALDVFLCWFWSLTFNWQMSLIGGSWWRWKRWSLCSLCRPERVWHNAFFSKLHHRVAFKRSFYQFGFSSVDYHIWQRSSPWLYQPLYLLSYVAIQCTLGQRFSVFLRTLYLCLIHWWKFDRTFCGFLSIIYSFLDKEVMIDRGCFLGRLRHVQLRTHDVVSRVDLRSYQHGRFDRNLRKIVCHNTVGSHDEHSYQQQSTHRLLFNLESII